jgi:hypothetical protein
MQAPPAPEQDALPIHEAAPAAAQAKDPVLQQPATSGLLQERRCKIKFFQ